MQAEAEARLSRALEAEALLSSRDAELEKLRTPSGETVPSEVHETVRAELAAMQERLQAAEAEVAAGAAGAGAGGGADGGAGGGAEDGAGGAAAAAQVEALRAELETLKTSRMPGLPAGWIWQHDPGLNKLFFVDTNTGQVQWEPPPAPDAPALTPAESAEGEAAAQAAAQASSEAAAALERLHSVEAELEETKGEWLVAEYTAATSRCSLLLPVAPSVSCSCVLVDARLTLRDTNFHRLLPSPAVSQCPQPV